MRHSNKNRTLSRPSGQRTSLLRGLSVSLIRDGKITTTLAKAKELQPRIASRLGEPSDSIIKKLFTDIAPKYVTRNGGYTRVVKMGRMPSGREQAVIEFVE